MSRPRSTRSRAPTPPCSCPRSITAPDIGGATGLRNRARSREAPCCGRSGSGPCAGGRGRCRPRPSPQSAKPKWRRCSRWREENVAGAAERAALWRGAAARLLANYDGRTEALIEASGKRLGGPEGLLARLAEFEAFSDPLQKKSFLVAKIWERRGWLRVEDPEAWQVCADNVLMRLALRAGLVEMDEVEALRADTRRAWKLVAERVGVSPPVLDDLLWERGREDPDLLGAAAGDLREPPRPPGTIFY